MAAMNQVEFAAYLGVAPSTVYAWENGQNPIPRWAVKLLRALERLEAVLQPELPMGVLPGLCACGCGRPTVKNWRTDRSKGWIKGEYRAYISGHNATFERAER